MREGQSRMLRGTARISTGSEIPTGWVMCACVKDDHRMFRGIAQIFHESGEIETLLLRVPVAVLVQPSESRIPE
jgi:hypothetical protein